MFRGEEGEPDGAFGFYLLDQSMRIDLRLSQARFASLWHELISRPSSKLRFGFSFLAYAVEPFQDSTHLKSEHFIRTFSPFGMSEDDDNIAVNIEAFDVT